MSHRPSRHYSSQIILLCVGWRRLWASYLDLEGLKFVYFSVRTNRVRKTENKYSQKGQFKSWMPKKGMSFKKLYFHFPAAKKIEYSNLPL